MSPRAPYASDPARSRGRQHVEPGGETRGPRTAFQRDRDRIIHSIAFRRLRQKTQVFAAPDGDHFRVRLTHSLEVAQIGRTMARALGADEDLTEALCLAHDIGHPPFGHSGEKALKDATAHAGGFDHNAHTLRVLTRLEAPYPCWEGLNLTWETLEGLAKHNGPVTQPGWALTGVDAAFPLALGEWSSVEAQIAAIADDIAYDNHDIDDGLRAGLIEFDAVVSQPLVAPGWRAVQARFPNLPREKLLGELIREQIGRMVNDVLARTRHNLGHVASAQEVRAAGRPMVSFSPEMAEQERGFKRFMYAELYHSPYQLEVAEQAGRIVAGLTRAYLADPGLLPDGWAERVPEAEPARTRHVADFIAGMTDRYAIARHRELIGPTELPDAF